jgi:protein-disulfide isomerase
MPQGQKLFYGTLGVVLVAGGIFLYQKMGHNGPISIPVNAPIVAADTSGFKGYMLGNQTATVEITEYADLQCPACAAFATVQLPDVKKRLFDTGKAWLRYRDYPLDELHSNPRVAAHAAACADAQGGFWPVAEGIYQRQADWSPLPNPVPVLKEVVVAAGLNAGKWTDCMEAKTYAGRIQASRAEGDALGLKSTPSFLIGGRVYEAMSSDEMVKIVDSIIASKKPVPSAVKKP